MSLLHRPRILEKQSDDTIALRKLADLAEDAEWEEEITRPGTLPEITVNITNPLPQASSVQLMPAEAKPEPSLPAPARVGLAFVKAVDTWPRVVGLCILAAAAYWLGVHFLAEHLR